MIGFLVNNGVSFVIRGVGNRAIKEGIVEKNFKEEVEKMKFEYKLPDYVRMKYCIVQHEELVCVLMTIRVKIK
ncbi:hypothetical protein MASR1M36_11180 [Candidatus Cloacimonadaceae bacterium]